MRGTRAVAVAFVLALGGTGVARAQQAPVDLDDRSVPVPPDEDDVDASVARALFEQALTRYHARRWSEACQLLDESLALAPAGVHADTAVRLRRHAGARLGLERLAASVVAEAGSLVEPYTAPLDPYGGEASHDAPLDPYAAPGETSATGVLDPYGSPANGAPASDAPSTRTATRRDARAERHDAPRRLVVRRKHVPLAFGTRPLEAERCRAGRHEAPAPLPRDSA